MSSQNRILGMLQDKVPSYHPLVSMLNIALNDDADLRLQFDCHREIAKYVEAQRKSIDVKSEDGSELIKLNIFLDEPTSPNSLGEVDLDDLR